MVRPFLKSSIRKSPRVKREEVWGAIGVSGYMFLAIGLAQNGFRQVALAMFLGAVIIGIVGSFVALGKRGDNS